MFFFCGKQNSIFYSFIWHFCVSLLFVKSLWMKCCVRLSWRIFQGLLFLLLCRKLGENNARAQNICCFHKLYNEFVYLFTTTFGYSTKSNSIFRCFCSVCFIWVNNGNSDEIDIVCKIKLFNEHLEILYYERYELSRYTRVMFKVK